MRLRLYCCCLVSIFATTILSAGEPQALQIAFFDQQVQLDYQREMLNADAPVLEELALRRAAKELAELPYQLFLQSLQEQAGQLALNDWFYTQLLRESLQALIPDEHLVELWTYVLLAKSGFDTRLTYRRSELQVNVYTEDVLYEVPLIQEDGRQYANLSAAGKAWRPQQAMYLLNHRPNASGRPFTFKLTHWPRLLQESRERRLSFRYGQTRYSWDIAYAPGIAGLLQHYPLIDEHWYLEAPLSPSLAQSLVPKLQQLLAGKPQAEALQILVSLTRSGFVYEDDKTAFQANKPMVADEVFHYPKSDCEDRAALFYALTKVLLDLPMIVIAYEDHLTIAVASQEVAGAAVNYQGRRYVFCDPTGPENSIAIGKIPPGYEGERFEIIGAYTPKKLP
jgi:hypothetical protein